MTETANDRASLEAKVPRVFLETVRPPRHAAAEALVDNHHALFERLARQSEGFEVVDSASGADIILAYVSFPFYLPYLDASRRCVRRHPLRQEFPDRFFVYDPEAHAVPFARGVYANLHGRWYDGSRQRPGPYIHYLADNPELFEPRSRPESARWLFSFIGDASTHPIRRRIVPLTHPRALVEGDRRWSMGVGRWLEYKERYAQLIHESKFILCPRGRGTSSIRIFEVMRAGRVPVIISDDWVPPLGPNWDEFSIRVAETQISDLPAILEARESQAAEMGSRARESWLAWFSDDMVVSRIIDSCLSMKKAHGSKPRFGFRVWLQWIVWHRYWRGMQTRARRLQSHRFSG